MSIADKITRLTTAKTNIATALEAKGVSVEGHGFEDFATDIGGLAGGEYNMTAILNDDGTQSIIATTAGGGIQLQTKSVTVTENGSSTITADTGYDGLAQVNLTTNVDSNTPYVYYGRHCDENGIWTYPEEEWSQTVNGVYYDDNIELIPIVDNEQVLYYLMDVRNEYAFSRWRVYTNATTFTVGVCNDGVFTAIDTPTDVASSGYYANWIADYHTLGYDFIVLKIAPTDASKPFTTVTPQTWASDGTHTALVNLSAMPILMRYGNAPSCNSIAISNFTIESDNVLNFASALTNTALTMGGMYSTCYSLQRVRMTGWNIANNYTTSVASAFNGCYILSDVPNGILDCSNWCSARTTSMASFISGSYAITKIKVSNWIVSGITNMSSAFANCQALREIIGLETWSGTAPATTIASMFSGDKSLRSVNLGSISLSSSLTTIYNMFSICEHLTSITLPATLDFSNVTTTASMFSGCHSLKTISHGTIVPTTTKLTTMASMFANCYSLQSIDILKNWVATNARMETLFSTCRSLTSTESIDMTGFVIPTVSTAYGTNPSAYYNCLNLTYCDYSWFNCATDSSSGKTMTGSMMGGLTNIVDYYPPQNLQGADINLSTYYKLSHDSLLRIANALPTASKKLTLGTCNKNKLSAEEQAIITGKGWTLA